MRDTKIKATVILLLIAIAALIAIKFLFGFLMWLLKWAIILGISATVIYFIYYVIRKDNYKQKRNLK